MSSESSVTNETAKPNRSHRSWLTLPLWILAGACIVGAIVARIVAPEIDHALANLLTAGLSFLAWAFLLAVLFLGRSPAGLKLTVLLAPMVFGVVFLAMYKFERRNSELIPQFSPRWQAETVLPTATSDGEPVDELTVPRESDFPQFLGPTRDGRLDVSIAAAWESNPPSVAWKQPIGEGWSGFVVQGDAAITMEQRDKSEWVSAYSIIDGALIWKYEIEALHTNVAGGTGPRSTPAIANNRVYACSAVDQLVCLDIKSGGIIWSQDLLKLADSNQSDFETSVTWGRAGSPLVHNGLVIVPFGGNSDNAQPIIAFDAEEGHEVWRGGSGQAGYSSPSVATLDGVEQILLVSENKLAAYSPAVGKELWSTEWAGLSNGDPSVAQPIIIDATRVIIAKGYGEGSQMLKVQQIEGKWNVEPVWRSKSNFKTKFTTGVLRDGFCYGLSDGILECIDVETGKRQWKKGRYRHGQLLLLNEHLLIVSERGELVLVPASPEKFEELANVPIISDVSWNTLALSGNRLLMRNAEEVACVVLPIIGDLQGETSSDVTSSENANAESSTES